MAVHALHTCCRYQERHLACVSVATTSAVSSLGSRCQILFSACNMSVLCDASRVGVLPTVHVLQDFLTVGQEEELLRSIAAHAARNKWTQVSGRKLLCLGGSVHAKGLIQQTLPAWVQSVALDVFERTGRTLYGGQQPNHVLINSYLPGEGLMPHEDGPAYHPSVAILSLNASCVIRFYRKPPAGEGRGPPEMSLVLLPRSLLVFSDEAYTHCLHGIDAVSDEVLDESVQNVPQSRLEGCSTLHREAERISLTVRLVPKVIKCFAGLKRP